MDVWYLHERQDKWELRRLVGIKHITTSLEVVDWDGMDMWWGLGEEMYGGGRPRRTWLESVEADIAELEIDKEMQKECYEEEV